MCIPTENGFIMADKVKITHKQILKGEISKKHSDELYGTPMSVVDGVHIRHNLHELRNDLQKLYTPEVINPLINKRLMSIFYSTTKILTAIGIILTAGYNIYNYLF